MPPYHPLSAPGLAACHLTTLSSLLVYLLATLPPSLHFLFTSLPPYHPLSTLGLQACHLTTLSPLPFYQLATLPPSLSTPCLPQPACLLTTLSLRFLSTSLPPYQYHPLSAPGLPACHLTTLSSLLVYQLATLPPSLRSLSTCLPPYHPLSAPCLPADQLTRGW